MTLWRKKILAIAFSALLLQAAAACYIYFHGIPGLYTPTNETSRILARSKGYQSPLVLSAQDVSTYKQVIQAQHKKQWEEADRLLRSVENPILAGHILAKRYLHESYRASEKELTGWLDRYADHPYAAEVYEKLPQSTAQHMSIPANYHDLPKTKTTLLGSEMSRRYWGEWTYQQVPAEADKLRRLAVAAEKKIQSNPQQDIGAWLKKESGNAALSPLASDLLRWFTAWNYYARGQMRMAYHHAQTAADRSGYRAPSLHWLAGMAAWQQGAEALAAKHFSRMAGALPAHHTDGAAAHYWAARAYEKMGEKISAKEHRQKAAEDANSFYGMLAASESNHPLQIANMGKVTAPNWHAWLSMPVVQRAAALKQLGLDKAAERHLIFAFHKQQPRAEQMALMAATHALGYTQVASQMQGVVTPEQNRFWWAQLPVPQWKPRDSWRLPKALVLAVAQHESAMKATAQSHAGAQGLMQLMPLTASAMADLAGWPDVPELKNISAALNNPELNLTLGQRYLYYLSKQPEVRGNLIAMLAAYNAGPAPIGEWLATHRADQDPLSFIEAIPYAETRQYVQQTLMLYWAYNARLGMSQESLLALSNAQWPSLFDTRDMAQNSDSRL